MYKSEKKVLRKVLHTNVKATLVNIPMHLLKHQLCYLKFKQMFVLPKIKPITFTEETRAS